MSMLSRLASMSTAAATGVRFVGATTAAVTGSTATTTDVSLTSLLGGAAVLEGDVVIVYYAAGSTADRALTITTTGYTQIADLYANDTFDANLTVAWKRMGATPDTLVTVSATGATGDSGVVAIHVWRGVDSLVPLDGQPVTATGIDSALCNPPAITPTATGAVIVAGGAAAHNGGGSIAGIGGPTFSSSNLSNFVTLSGPNATNDVTIGLGSAAWTSGAFDPAAFTFSVTDSVSFSWAAVTLALLPSQGQVGPFAIATEKSQRGSNGTTIVINKPAGTRDGDLMIAVMNTTGNSTWTGDTSWNEVADQGTNPSTRIAWKVAASEGASYTFTSTFSGTSSGSIVTYRNAAYDAVGTITSAANPLVLSAVTASVNHARILATVARSTLSVTITGPATMQTLSTDADGTSPSRLVEQDASLSSSGSSGTRSFTMGSNTNVSGALVSIKPAASYTKYTNYTTSTSTQGNSVSSLSVNVPTGTTPDNVLLLAVTAASSSGAITVTTPTGWTLLSGTAANGYSPALYFFYRIADGSETASYTVTLSKVCGAAAAMVRVAGADAAAIRAGTITSGSTLNTFTASAVTATANDLLLYVCALGVFDSVAFSITPPSGMTEIVDANTTDGVSLGSTLEIAYLEGVSAGSTGTKAGSTLNGTSTAYRTVLLRLPGK